VPSTSQLLTWIEEQSHGWQREGSRGSRPLLNEAHRILLTGERKQFLILDPAIGNLPFLATVARTFQYNLPGNVWLLKAIVQDRDEQTNQDPWQYEDIEVAKNRYYRIMNADAQQSVFGQSAASVMFLGVDPGNQAALYRYYAFRWPVNITSDTVQHEMPGTTDMDYLVPATIKLIEGIDHGNLIEAREYIKKELAPKIGTALDKGEHGVPKYVTKRSF